MSFSSIDTCAIGVMAKAPQAGRSKTRLCPPLSPIQAAALSAAFLHDTTENMALAGRSAAIAAYAAYAPLGAEKILRPYLATGTELLLADGSPPMPDGVTGFGRSLLHAIQGMLLQGHKAACVLSSDIPTLPTRLLCQMAEILLQPGDHAVFGAADDGGYYVLGLKAPHAAFFRDIGWSTASVARETRNRACELGIELIELDTWYDVDDVRSLNRLLEANQGYAAPRTHAVIEQLGLHHLLQPHAERGAAE